MLYRPSDRRRGMAAAKAESQRRLMMPRKRRGHEESVCNRLASIDTNNGFKSRLDMKDAL